MRAVIDASSVGALVLPDEGGGNFDRFVDFMGNLELVQPVHWPIEVAGLVLKASRRDRFRPEERAVVRQMIGLLIGGAAVETSSAAIAAFDLAVKFNISVYDAAYLELALRLGLPLMTGDGALAKALPKAGVTLLARP